MMYSKILQRLGAFVLVGAVMATAACERVGTEPDPHFDDVVRINLIDRDTGAQLAHTHGDPPNSWHPSELPHLHEGEEIEVNVEFIARGNVTVPLGGEWTVRACIWHDNHCDDDLTDGVIEIHNHGDHVDIEAVGHGHSEIAFMLWHGNHPDYVSPAIRIEVEDHD